MNLFFELFFKVACRVVDLSQWQVFATKRKFLKFKLIIPENQHNGNCYRQTSKGQTIPSCNYSIDDC